MHNLIIAFVNEPVPCTDPERFVRVSTFFYLIRGGRIKIPLQAGHHQMAFRWRADDDPTLNAGLEVLCFLCTPKKLWCQDASWDGRLSRTIFV